jgi:hypothetical protein
LPKSIEDFSPGIPHWLGSPSSFIALFVASMDFDESAKA